MGFRESLMAQAEAKRDEIEELFARSREISLQIADAQRYCERLNPLLEAEGLDPIQITPKSAKTGFAAPGNRGKGMPSRREMFLNVSLGDAVEMILTSAEEMHADALVKVIYDISTPQEHAKAKRSLVGTLAEYTRKGRWERPQPNVYRLKRAGTAPEPQLALNNGAH